MCQTIVQQLGNTTYESCCNVSECQGILCSRWTEENYGSLVAILKWNDDDWSRRVTRSVLLSSFRTLPFAENEKRAFIDVMFHIDFDSSIDHLPIFVLNILKLCIDETADHEISSSSSFILDRLIDYFIDLDSKAQQYLHLSRYSSKSLDILW